MLSHTCSAAGGAAAARCHPCRQGRGRKRRRGVGSVGKASNATAALSPCLFRVSRAASRAATASAFSGLRHAALNICGGGAAGRRESWCRGLGRPVCSICPGGAGHQICPDGTRLGRDTLGDGADAAPQGERIHQTRRLRGIFHLQALQEPPRDGHGAVAGARALCRAGGGGRLGHGGVRCLRRAQEQCEGHFAAVGGEQGSGGGSGGVLLRETHRLIAARKPAARAQPRPACGYGVRGGQPWCRCGLEARGRRGGRCPGAWSALPCPEHKWRAMP